MKHPKDFAQRSTLHYEMRPAIQDPTAPVWRICSQVLDLPIPFEVVTDTPPKGDEGWYVSRPRYVLSLKKATRVSFGYPEGSGTSGDTYYVDAGDTFPVRCVR